MENLNTPANGTPAMTMTEEKQKVLPLFEEKPITIPELQMVMSQAERDYLINRIRSVVKAELFAELSNVEELIGNIPNLIRESLGDFKINYKDAFSKAPATPAKASRSEPKNGTLKKGEHNPEAKSWKAVQYLMALAKDSPKHPLGFVSVSELCEKTGITRGSISPTISNYEKKGFIFESVAQAFRDTKPIPDNMRSGYRFVGMGEARASFPKKDYWSLSKIKGLLGFGSHTPNSEVLKLLERNNIKPVRVQAGRPIYFLKNKVAPLVNETRKGLTKK